MADIDNPTHMSRVDGNYTEVVTDDTVQHGIDDNPTGDAEKGATLGGIGGAAVGLAAGAVAGPVGAIVGAVIGGVAGAAASGAAVAAVDRVDNDNTISGVGGGATTDVSYDNTVDRPYTTSGVVDTTGYNPNGTIAPVVPAGVTGYNTVPGEDGASIKTGGYANDGTPDTRGVGEKFVDAITGDDVDDKTGKVVNHDSAIHGTDSLGRVNDTAYVGGAGTTATAYTTPGTTTTGAIVDTPGDIDTNTGANRMQTLGENVPSIKTGGYANDGTPDTRGVAEKTADAITGDVVDDKTGKVVNHP